MTEIQLAHLRIAALDAALREAATHSKRPPQEDIITNAMVFFDFLRGKFDGDNEEIEEDDDGEGGLAVTDELPPKQVPVH